MGHVDVVDRCSGCAKGGECLLDTVGHLWIQPRAEVGGDTADPDPRQRPLKVGGISRNRFLQRRRITGVVPGDRLQHQRAIGSGAGHGADLVEARCKGHQSAAADPAVGGLQSGDAAQPRRLPDRSAGVGANGHRRHVGGHAGGGTTTRSSRCPRQVPGVVHRAEGGVFV